MEIVMTLRGLKPMIQHSERMANPLDSYARTMKELSAKRKKTEEDYLHMMMTEARGSAYETPEGLIGLPTRNVWKSLYTAATAYKLGQSLKRALLFEDVVEPLLVGGKTVDVGTLLADPENVDYRSVVVQRSRTMRARPIIRDWSSSHSFTLLTDEVDSKDLIPVIERAGRLVGLCEWRPMYGTYEATIEEVEG